MQNCKIHHSVVGLRSCISEGAVIEDTLLMGADYYEVKPAVDEIFVTYSMTEKKKHPIFYE
jgi:ADP-glucose pyrophosphorylase